MSRIFFALEDLVGIAEQTFCVYCTEEFQDESRQAINEAKKIKSEIWEKHIKPYQIIKDIDDIDRHKEACNDAWANEPINQSESDMYE